MRWKSLFGVFAFLTSINFVAAQPYLNNYNWRDWLSFFLGDVSGGGEILFIKLLLFLLLLAVINFVLKRVGLFNETPAVNGIVALIVSLIAVRYMTTQALINFIWLPYGTLGVLVSSILPFIIFLFFIESFDNSLIRKVGWVSYIIIYFALAYLKWKEFAFGGEWWQNLAWLYAIIAILSLLVLLFERKIRIAILISSIKKGEEGHNLILKAELRKELTKVNDALAVPGLSMNEGNRLKEERRRIMAAIARIS